jgi:hypothetical protein
MPLSIMSWMAAITWSLVLFSGSMVCFWISFQPWLPSVMLVPQYSQVMTISPNFGDIGAPQLGHFSAVAPAGAMTGALLCCEDGAWEPSVPG